MVQQGQRQAPKVIKMMRNPKTPTIQSNPKSRGYICVTADEGYSDKSAIIQHFYIYLTEIYSVKLAEWYKGTKQAQLRFQ